MGAGNSTEVWTVWARPPWRDAGAGPGVPFCARERVLRDPAGLGDEVSMGPFRTWWDAAPSTIASGSSGSGVAATVGLRVRRISESLSLKSTWLTLSRLPYAAAATT